MWKRVSSEFRSVFGVDEKAHSGHMMSVEQSVLDGTSKWSAKIAITGLWAARVRRFLNWSCAHSVPHAMSVSLIWCPSRYISVLRMPIYFDLYSASHRCLHISIYIYVMRVRTRLLWFFLLLLLLLPFHLDLTVITGSWWLPRVWLCCIDCAMNIPLLSNNYRPVIPFPYVIPEAVRPSCDNVDDIKETASRSSYKLRSKTYEALFLNSSFFFNFFISPVHLISNNLVALRAYTHDGRTTSILASETPWLTYPPQLFLPNQWRLLYVCACMLCCCFTCMCWRFYDPTFVRWM